MPKQTPMTPSAASRIQSHADRTGTNQGFKGRAQSGAAKNTATTGNAPSTGSGGSPQGGAKK